MDVTATRAPYPKVTRKSREAQLTGAETINEELVETTAIQTAYIPNSHSGSLNTCSIFANRLFERARVADTSMMRGYIRIRVVNMRLLSTLTCVHLSVPCTYCTSIKPQELCIP